MTSWCNLNLASQHIADTRTVPPPLIHPPQPPPLPPPPAFPPMLGVPSASILTPFPPSSIHMGFPCQSYNVPPPCNPNIPPPNILLFPPPIPGLSGNNSRMSDQTEGNFEILKEKLKKNYGHLAALPEKVSSKINISTIKTKLIRCNNLVRQLEGLLNCLQITHKSLSEEEWILRCKEIEILKAELSELMSLSNPENVKEMLRIIQARRKKMQYRKRKRKEWQEQKKEFKMSIESEDRRINLWLEKMKDEVSRAKREEDIKREADLVLSDVTAKKGEAKRMLNLLNSLAKLRAARVKQLQGSQPSLDHESDAFNKIIERLKKMWLDQIKEYNVEEQGLKVMLEHAEEERILVEVAKCQKNLKSWSRVIFGSSNTNTGPPQSLEELIQTRHDWDNFITTENTLMASSIPIGWVLPSEPSSEEWKKLLT